MKKVMVFGTFDILHPGHLHMLKEAKEHGDFLVVIIARDQTVSTLKGKKPQHDEAARVKNLEALNIADEVRLGSLGDKYKVIREEKPDIIALGYDQKFFTEQLTTVVGKETPVIRLAAYMPEIYKSSKLAATQN